METRVCRLYGANDIRIETETLPAPGPGEAVVAIARGGICGSDLHYFEDGGFGPIRVREPIILGHEASATVLGVGPDVTGIAPGDRVAINPSRPCGSCAYCAAGLRTHCLNMSFNGSAMRLPHEQGLFRDRMIVAATQCIALPPDADLAAAACAEPLAVCLHAGNMAGALSGQRVLVTGAGPIGALCAAVAKKAGAAEIVVTDLQDTPLRTATDMGATRTINVARDGAEIDAYCTDKGSFDVTFECSAAGPAIRTAIAATRPQGTIVQIGVAGDVPVPINFLVSKEIRYQGTQRFDTEFGAAVDAIVGGGIDVNPIISRSYPLDAAAEAFRVAGDRTQAVKVHLSFAAP